MKCQHPRWDVIASRLNDGHWEPVRVVCMDCEAERAIVGAPSTSTTVRTVAQQEWAEHLLALMPLWRKDSDTRREHTDA